MNAMIREINFYFQTNEQEAGVWSMGGWFSTPFPNEKNMKREKSQL